MHMISLASQRISDTLGKKNRFNGNMLNRPTLQFIGNTPLR
jgi:hypothetical protein